jgi:hypothetical protein
MRRGHLRRAFLVGLLLALGGGCRTGLPADPPLARPATAALIDPPVRTGRPLIVIAMPDSPPFHVVRKSLVDELQQDFNIASTLISARTQLSDFARQIETLQPKAVVVMDNPVLALYRRYAESCPPARPAPPAVAVMTSFLEDLRNLERTTGIAYEVPGVTTFVQLRSVIARPVRRVAVLFRPRFAGFIARQAALAAREQITLVPVPVNAEPTASEVRSALRGAQASARMDALWVLNDNSLLRNAAFLEEAWRPEISRLGVPVVVGLSSLVAADARFGTFAVVPDHEALGVQTSQLIFKLADGGWQPDQHPIEPPISTVTIANLRRLQQEFGLQPGAAERVDKVVE